MIIQVLQMEAYEIEGRALDDFYCHVDGIESVTFLLNIVHQSTLTRTYSSVFLLHKPSKNSY